MCEPEPGCLLDIPSFFTVLQGGILCIKMGGKIEAQLFSKVRKQDTGRNSETFSQCRHTVPI